MNSTRTIINTGLAQNLSRAVTRSFASQLPSNALRCSHQIGLNVHRQFSTSRASQIEVFPPKKDLPNIKETRAAWPHPDLTATQLTSIQIDHRPTRSWSDKVALGMVKVLRWGTDLCTGYRHDDSKPYIMSSQKWLTRFIFLETVAGVPGMTAAMLRHFRSLRRLSRDNGHIESLLEDAYNERMHLLSFLKLSQPGWFMKTMILGAQGVFANGFFIAYLISPKTCHRFVGYLEEEAVKTYTYAIEDLDKGRIPEWNNMQAPDIAIKYWNMPEGHQTMRDLLLYVRADEAKHRELHHTFGNLKNDDPNPFVSQYKDESKPHPSKGFENLKSRGWEREEII